MQVRVLSIPPIFRKTKMKTELEELEKAMDWVRKELDDFYNEQLKLIVEQPDDMADCTKDDFIVFWIER